MSGTTLQVQRFLLLGLSGAGLLLLFYLLRSGWLQGALADLDARTTLRMFRGIITETPEARGTQFLAWFHLLLLLTFAASFLQVSISLLKPVRNPVLLSVDWGVLLAACSGMLFFWAYDLQPHANRISSWLTVQGAVLCSSLAMYAFGRSFLVFPAEMTDARANLYLRRYMRASSEFTATKRSAAGRWRRSMLAWQLRNGRRFLPKNMRRRHRELVYRPAVLKAALLYVLPGLTFASLSVFWTWTLLVADIRELRAVPLLAILGVVMAWSLVSQKILIDYRLGDASVRKQVLWLLIGIGVPLAVASVLTVAHVLPLFAPELFGYVLLFMFLYFPVLAYLLFVVCLMIAIFFYGAIDPERVLRVGTLYSFLSLVLTVLFAIVEQLLSPLLVNAIGLSGMEGSLVSAAIVALSFKPLRARIEVSLEKGFEKLLRDNALDSAPESNGMSKTELSESAG